jgi:DNA helicase II / ATP-dependent DNA helicase PcrA
MTVEEKIREMLEGPVREVGVRIENTIERLCRYIDDHRDDILQRYSDYSYELFKTATSETEKTKMRNMFAKDRTEITKGCRSSIRKYFNKSKINTTKLYKLFISSISDFNIYQYDKLNELKRETAKNIKNNSYDFEDLAALLYIKLLTSPNSDYVRIKHAVVDEAQDLGEFNFFTLKSTLPSATFSIFGDLAQSIYDYRGIDNWEEVNKTMFDANGNIINFNKSYRTTAEIMDVADDVAESIGLRRSDLVVRHGDKVQFTGADEKTIPEYIAQKICEYKEKGYKTIAVISKTDLLSNYINDDLASLGINIPNVTVNDDLSDERFKICTISNQLAKGLEFDAVIINNASETIYSSDKNLDMKLLYVAITRALHELDIVYSGN